VFVVAFFVYRLYQTNAANAGAHNFLLGGKLLAVFRFSMWVKMHTNITAQFSWISALAS